MPTRPIRHRSAILRTCAAVVSASLLPSVASAAIPTVSWAVDASGQWTTLTNWSPARAINYDNVVNAADFLLMDTAYAHQTGTLSPAFLSMRQAQFGDAYVQSLIAAVPEPSSLLTACGLALLPLTRRRQRHH